MNLARVKEALTRKVGVGKFKVPAWSLIAILIVGVYYYRKTHPAAASSAATSAGAAFASPAAPAVFTDGGGGGSSPPPADLAAQTAPVTTDPAATAPTPVKATAPAPAPSASPGTTRPAAPAIPSSPVPNTPANQATLAEKSRVNVIFGTSGKPVSELPAGATVAVSPTFKRPGFVGPTYGYVVPAGATNVHILPTGPVVYTTKTGAVIEQAPDKSRYRISVGSSGITPTVAPAPAAAAPATRQTAVAAPPRPAAPAAPKAPATPKAPVEAARHGLAEFA